MEQYELNLPKELETYRTAFEKSVKPFVEISAKKGETLIWESKFGGKPYLPIGCNYPTDKEGNFMFLLAQINLKKHHIEPFPTKGILQFYISLNDDVYGLNFENPVVQENFKVLYIPEVVKDEKEIISDFSFLPMPDGYSVPLTDECSLAFALDYQPIATGNLWMNFFGKDAIEFVAVQCLKMKRMQKRFITNLFFQGIESEDMHTFTQDDPREYNNHDHKILLLQIGAWGKMILCGAMLELVIFFIREEDLKNLDFSKVLYNWIVAEIVYLPHLIYYIYGYLDIALFIKITF